MNIRLKDKKFNDAREGQGIVPVKAHLTKTIALTNKDSLVSVIRLDGISYEEKSLPQLEAYKKLLNTSYHNIHDPRLGIWNCMLRRDVGVEVNKDLDCEFSIMLAENYHENIQEICRENTYYIALVYQPMPFGAKISKNKDKSLYIESLDAGTEILQDKVDALIESLLPYNPVVLGVDENKRSEIGRFYTDLIYFKPHEIPVRTENMANAVFNRRILFGNELIEIRHHTKSTYAAVLGIKEYSEETTPDMFVQLNSLPFEFNFVQSFLCIEKGKAKRMLEQQQNVLKSSGDVAKSQISAIDDALDDLISGRFAMGEHNASLIVHSNEQEDLKEMINMAQNAFQEPGIVVVREDLANEAHFLSQMPANHLYRPRPSPITSLNFASMAAMYGTPKGKKDGNYWGRAIVPFLSLTGQPYYHSNHVEDTGSLGMYGMTGSGKTVLMNGLETMLRRGNIRHVNFDKDEGSKVLVTALGGTYHTFKIGEPTGINPFALEPTNRNVYYVVDLIKILVGDVKSSELELIESAVRSVYNLSESKNKRFSALLNFLDTTVEDGVAARLKEWTGTNRHGWVFDNEVNKIELEDVIGFDFTDFLDHDQIRTPMMSYLLHRIMELIDGTPICIWMDEFWKLLKDDYFRESFLENQYKTIRKNEGILIIATQSPSDAINSPIARTLIEQTPTNIFLPNEKALKEDYVNGFRLTEAEWDIFSPLTKGSRQFLVKQSESSLLARFPLNGMEKELSVLSGRKAYNKIFEDLKNENGDLPKDWLDQYFEKTQQITGELKT